MKSSLALSYLLLSHWLRHRELFGERSPCRRPWMSALIICVCMRVYIMCAYAYMSLWCVCVCVVCVCVCGWCVHVCWCAHFCSLGTRALEDSISASRFLAYLAIAHASCQQCNKQIDLISIKMIMKVQMMKKAAVVNKIHRCRCALRLTPERAGNL